MIVLAAGVLAGAVLVWPHSARWGRRFESTSAKGGTEPLLVADALDLLALTMRSGAATDQAVFQVARASHHLQVQSLARVAAAMQWGMEIVDAWQFVPEWWKPARSAFTLANRSGAAPAPVLKQAADDLRRVEAERVAKAGARVGVGIVLPLGLCFLPAFMCLTVIPLVIGLVRPIG